MPYFSPNKITQFFNKFPIVYVCKLLQNKGRFAATAFANYQLINNLLEVYDLYIGYL
jgi:hypothetical protein